MRLSKPLCVLWNRGDAGCQRQCDRPPDPECRDRPSERAECRFARRLRTIGIGMVVASLIPFAIGMTVAATHWRIWFGRWISPPERSLHRKPAGGRQRGAFRRWLWVDFTL